VPFSFIPLFFLSLIAHLSLTDKLVVAGDTHSRQGTRRRNAMRLTHGTPTAFPWPPGKLGERVSDSRREQPGITGRCRQRKPRQKGWTMAEPHSRNHDVTEPVALTPKTADV
jgi:hypothetical protein